MPDCQMCWNDWPSLQSTPFEAVNPKVQVCRNCGRSMKQVIAFVRSKGFELATVSHETGVIVSRFGSGPQVGSETPQMTDEELVAWSKREEEPPDPPAKKPVKAR